MLPSFSIEKELHLSLRDFNKYAKISEILNLIHFVNLYIFNSVNTSSLYLRRFFFLNACNVIKSAITRSDCNEVPIKYKVWVMMM